MGKITIRSRFFVLVTIILFVLAGCASSGDGGKPYFDPIMDFGAVQTVAVLPFVNLTEEDVAAERVRSTFIGMLLSTETVYVVPTGEVARGISRAGLRNPAAPSPEEAIRFSNIVTVDAVFTGTLKEYGEVRSGNVTANVISLSLQLIETQTGKVVWTASTTKGGINVWDRLFGGGGEPMNDITEAAIDDLLDKLFEG
jgi:hypothetical protein